MTRHHRERIWLDTRQKAKVELPLHICSTLLTKRSMQTNIFQYIFRSSSHCQNTERATIHSAEQAMGKQVFTYPWYCLNCVILKKGNAARSIKITNALICWHSNPTSKNVMNYLQMYDQSLYKVIHWCTVCNSKQPHQIPLNKRLIK